MVNAIATAFNADDPTLDVQVSRGRGLQADELADWMGDNDVLRVLVGVDVDPRSEVYRQTRGAIVEGRCMMYVFAKTDTAAIDALRAWWRKLAPGVGSTVLHNIETQTTHGGLVFMRWLASTGFNDSATRYGDLWMADQLVEYTVREV